jgi:hypothetical protein
MFASNHDIDTKAATTKLTHPMHNGRQSCRKSCLRRLWQSMLAIALLIAALLLYARFCDKRYEHITITIRLVGTASRALRDYKEAHGEFPAPEENRLPRALLEPTDFVTEHLSTTTFTFSGKVLPPDPYDKSRDLTRYSLSVDYNTLSHRDRLFRIPTAGPALRYYTSGTIALIVSNGPDMKPDITAIKEEEIERGDLAYPRERYDVTNGAFSAGDIFRLVD